MKLLCLIALCFTLGKAGIVKRAHSCGGSSYLTQPNGLVTSHTGYDLNHHYGKNLDCIWRIEAPPGLHVLLTAESFNVEDDDACSFDYLVLYDGNSTAANEISRYCGSSFNPVSSTGRFLTLEFITDGDTQLAGFKLRYTFTTRTVSSCGNGQFNCTNQKCIDGSYRCDGDDDCGDDSDESNCAGFTKSNCAANEYLCANGVCVDSGWTCDGDDDCGDGSDENVAACPTTSHGCGNQNLTGSSGSLVSPNYPNHYPINLRCRYYIQGPIGTKTLAFKFETPFDIETDNGCTYDSVTVHSDGGAFNHGPFCGTVSPGQFTVPGNHAIVEFVTDGDDSRDGFRLDWKALQ